MTVGLFHLRNPTCLQQVFPTNVFPTKKGAQPGAVQQTRVDIQDNDKPWWPFGRH